MTSSKSNCLGHFPSNRSSNTIDLELPTGGGPAAAEADAVEAADDFLDLSARNSACTTTTRLSMSSLISKQSCSHA